MQDFCFKTPNGISLTRGLKSLGLVVDGRVVGDLLYIGQVVATPGARDPETGRETSAPTFLDGEYAIYRATDEQAALIGGATWPEGVSLVDPPDGMPRLGGEWLTPDLEVLKTAACERIDTTAEALRDTALTPGSGQMAAYLAKTAQARALLQDPEPTEANYPDIFNEVGITADTAHEVAMTVLAAAEKCRLLGRGIEKARLAGKQAVRAAETLAAVVSAEAAVVWPKPE